MSDPASFYGAAPVAMDRGGFTYERTDSFDEPRAVAYEYRIVQKNGRESNSTSTPAILNPEVARAGVVWQDHCWPSLAPHRIERREWRGPNEWEPEPA